MSEFAEVLIELRESDVEAIYAEHRACMEMVERIRATSRHAPTPGLQRRMQYLQRKLAAVDLLRRY